MNPGPGPGLRPHDEQEIAKQVMAYKRQIGEEGLDKSSTYSKADYKKPVGVVTEQITRVKSKCPLLLKKIVSD
jgi:hypothetical protein